MGYADLERNGFWVCHEHFTKSFAPQMGLFCVFRNRRSNATDKPDMWDSGVACSLPPYTGGHCAPVASGAQRAEKSGQK